MADEQQELDALQTILTKGSMVKASGQEDYARDLIDEFIDSVAEEATAVSDNTLALIDQKIAELDALINDQLNEVMHHESFKTLEARWRGLHYLVFGTETGEKLHLRLLNASEAELADDFKKALEFDQSHLFKSIYEEEYGTFGGNPYTCLMADVEFSRSDAHMNLMGNLAEVAAAAHAPLIAGAAPELFDLNSFADIGGKRDLSKIFMSNELTEWRAFRDREDSRYLALTLPHILMRKPYGQKGIVVEGLNFEEDIKEPAAKITPKDAEGNPPADGPHYVWGNAAWALAQRVTNAFSLYGWLAAIRGVEGGGAVKGLPTHTFETDSGEIALKCPTEVAITDRREKELSDLGFITLCHCKGTNYAAFFGGQTTQKPKKYNTDFANSNAALSARLPYVLNASRFAHYLKAIMRDKVGSFLTAANVEEYLNTWIAEYVLLTDDAPQETKARFPLREARVDVREIPGRPGSYNATVFLRPHFQMEELTASIRLVAELPPPAA